MKYCKVRPIMALYDFRAIKDKNNKNELPSDINEQIETLALKIEDIEGLEVLKNYRQRKWFGEVYLWDRQGRMIATALFDHGICFRYNIMNYRKDSGNIVSMLSVKNNKLKRKPKDE